MLVWLLTLAPNWLFKCSNCTRQCCRLHYSSTCVPASVPVFDFCDWPGLSWPCLKATCPDFVLSLDSVFPPAHLPAPVFLTFACTLDHSPACHLCLYLTICCCTGFSDHAFSYLPAQLCMLLTMFLMVLHLPCAASLFWTYDQSSASQATACLWSVKFRVCCCCHLLFWPSDLSLVKHLLLTYTVDLTTYRHSYLPVLSQPLSHHQWPLSRASKKVSICTSGSAIRYMTPALFPYALPIPALRITHFWPLHFVSTLYWLLHSVCTHSWPCTLCFMCVWLLHSVFYASLISALYVICISNPCSLCECILDPFTLCNMHS